MFGCSHCAASCAESVPFRDSFESTFPALAATNPHTCSDAQLHAAPAGASGAVASAASGSLRPCVDAGHTFPQDERADGCKPDRVLVRDALSTGSETETDAMHLGQAAGEVSGASALKASFQALIEVFASPFGEQRLVSEGELIFPSDHRGLLVCFAHAKSETRAALIVERARLRAATAPLHPKSMFEYRPHAALLAAATAAAPAAGLSSNPSHSSAAAIASDAQPSTSAQTAAWNMAITCPSARIARSGGSHSAPAISSFLTARTNMKPFPRRFRQTYGIACAVDTDARSAFWSAHGVDERHTVTLELQRPLHAFGKLMVLTGIDGMLGRRSDQSVSSLRYS
jgi:hypothetical protein